MKRQLNFTPEAMSDIMLQGADMMLTPGLPNEDTVKEVFGTLLLILNQLEKENRLLKSKQ